MAKSSSNFFESSSIQSSYERIEGSQFSMVILERETSAQFGEHAGRARRSFLAARLATETRGGEHFGLNIASEAISERLILKISLG